VSGNWQLFRASKPLRAHFSAGPGPPGRFPGGSSEFITLGIARLGCLLYKSDNLLNGAHELRASGPALQRAINSQTLGLSIIPEVSKSLEEALPSMVSHMFGWHLRAP